MGMASVDWLAVKYDTEALRLERNSRVNASIDKLLAR